MVGNSQEIMKISIPAISLKMIDLRVQPCYPGTIKLHVTMEIFVRLSLSSYNPGSLFTE